jgi:EPS-associated MarR family transcriptional regulator
MKPTIETSQILRAIFKNPHTSQREIALKNRISLGKVNYAIQSLIEKGYIKIHNFSGSKSKRKYMYVLTPMGIYEKTKLTSEFLKLKMEEYDRLTKEIEELEADVNGLGQGSLKAEDADTDSLFAGRSE